MSYSQTVVLIMPRRFSYPVVKSAGAAVTLPVNNQSTGQVRPIGVSYQK